MVGVPQPTIERLVIYYRHLKKLAENNSDEVISSLMLGNSVGVSAAQVRKDLSYFGEFGCKGVGYQISNLKKSLAKILGFDQHWPIIMVGAGNIGRALVNYPGFKMMGLDIVAIFDCDLDKIGQRVGRINVKSDREISQYIRKTGIEIAIIAVPVEEAQSVAEKLVAAGIRAIWNFAPVTLKLPANIMVYYEDLASSLVCLTYRYSQVLGRTGTEEELQN